MTELPTWMYATQNNGEKNMEKNTEVNNTEVNTTENTMTYEYFLSGLLLPGCLGTTLTPTHDEDGCCFRQALSLAASIANMTEEDKAIHLGWLGECSYIDLHMVVSLLKNSGYWALLSFDTHTIERLYAFLWRVRAIPEIEKTINDKSMIGRDLWHTFSNCPLPIKPIKDCTAENAYMFYGSVMLTRQRN